MSRQSMTSASTESSTATIVPEYGVHNLRLSDVCSFIDGHKSLQSAAIVTTECYSEPAGAVTHRFLVLELRRPGRKNIWLRLDRRRGEGISLLRFFALSGETKANDRVRTMNYLSHTIQATKHMMVHDRHSYPPIKTYLLVRRHVKIGRCSGHRLHSTS